MNAVPPASETALEELVRLLGDPRAPVAASTVPAARDVHIADSLSALELEPIRSAGRIADLGSGAGLPGLVIAAVAARLHGST